MKKYNVENDDFKSTTALEEAIKNGWVDDLLEDTINHYKRIIDLAIVPLEKYLDILRDTPGFIKAKTITDLENLIHLLKSESYGTKE